LGLTFAAGKRRRAKSRLFSSETVPAYRPFLTDLISIERFQPLASFARLKLTELAEGIFLPPPLRAKLKLDNRHQRASR
jgi:hypothetical protein